jgi:hypothetical protein
MSLLSPLPKEVLGSNCDAVNSALRLRQRCAARAHSENVRRPTADLREGSEVYGLPDRKYGEATTRNFRASVRGGSGGVEAKTSTECAS